jgi:hypothetical protein
MHSDGTISASVKEYFGKYFRADGDRSVPNGAFDCELVSLQKEKIRSDVAKY